MNSDPNSDCKQCTESKLGRVHRVHTLNPDCMHTAPRPHSRRALGAVSWLRFGCVAVRTRRVAGCVACACAPCRRPLRSQYKNSIATQTSAARVAALLRRIADLGALCRVARPLSCHDTNDRIVTHLSGQAMRACAAAYPTCKPAVSQGLLAV